MSARSADVPALHTGAQHLRLDSGRRAARVVAGTAAARRLMFTDPMRVRRPDEVDYELVTRLHRAYDAVS